MRSGSTTAEADPGQAYLRPDPGFIARIRQNG